MTNSHVFEVINKFTGSPVATFLLRTDAMEFVEMRNAKMNSELYRVHAIHISDKPFPATLSR